MLLPEKEIKILKPKKKKSMNVITSDNLNYQNSTSSKQIKH